jgi:hypothetical protein
VCRPSGSTAHIAKRCYTLNPFTICSLFVNQCVHNKSPRFRGKYPIFRGELACTHLAPGGLVIGEIALEESSEYLDNVRNRGYQLSVRTA